MKLKFEWRNGDILCTEIIADFGAKKVSFTNFTDDALDCAFGKHEKVTWELFKRLLEDRCFEPGRADSNEILRSFGLPVYDPLCIIRVTNGVMAGDPFSLKIVGEVK